MDIFELFAITFSVSPRREIQIWVRSFNPHLHLMMQDGFPIRSPDKDKTIGLSLTWFIDDAGFAIETCNSFAHLGFIAHHVPI